MNPRIYFHVSYSFHKWFLYHRGDFDPECLDSLKRKVIAFEALWTAHEDEILTLIPLYMGVGWPFTEIHVYCFENAEYYPVPCISDPVSINMTGEDLHLFLLYVIHELVHVIMQFHTTFSSASLRTQEAIAYFVANEVLSDVVSDASSVIKSFTIPWPCNFPQIAEEFKKKVNLEEHTALELLEDKIL